MESSLNSVKLELPGLGLPLNWLPNFDESCLGETKLFRAALDVYERDYGDEDGEAAYVNPAETKSVHLLTAPVYL